MPAAAALPPARPTSAAMRARRPWRAIGAALEAFSARFPIEERLLADPVHLAHRYARPEDVEVAALVASSLAFGRAASVIAKARAALDPLGPRPADAIASWAPGHVPPHLERFAHRWVTGRDLAGLLGAAGGVIRSEGSLGAAFGRDVEAHASGDDLLAPMTAFARRLAARGSGVTLGRRHLLPVPDGKAASKRLSLLLRWMVRPADGVDLGLWSEAGAQRLTIPLDTHVARIGTYVGLTRRGTPGWAMAREITRNLARFDAADPTRFDFALAHLGIMGACPRRRDVRRCASCDLVPICRL